jgi:hypothetical protein
MRYVERFGRDSIHVAVFDDLVADPQAFVDELLAWLGIEPVTLDEEMLEARLPASRARSVLVARLVRMGAVLARAADGANLVGRIKRSPVVQRMLYRPLAGDRPEMTDDERRAVHDALADDLALLERELGLELASRWGWPHRGLEPRTA